MQHEPNDPAISNLAIQSPPYAVGMLTHPSANVDFLDGQPISQLRSLAAEIQDISSFPYDNPTPPSFLALIPDEELEEYFNAPITHPPSSSSFPMHHHLQIIKKELQKSFPLDSAISARLERSLLRVSEASDANVLIALRQVCTDIALSLSPMHCQITTDSKLADMTASRLWRSWLFLKLRSITS